MPPLNPGEQSFTPSEMAAALSVRIMDSMKEGSGAELKNLCQAYVWLSAAAPVKDAVLEVRFADDAEKYAV